MSDILSQKEIEKLKKLGKAIVMDLSCNINGENFPCRTCRFTAIENMIEYLKIHDIEVFQR